MTFDFYYHYLVNKKNIIQKKYNSKKMKILNFFLAFTILLAVVTIGCNDRMYNNDTSSINSDSLYNSNQGSTDDSSNIPNNNSDQMGRDSVRNINSDSIQ